MTEENVLFQNSFLLVKKKPPATPAGSWYLLRFFFFKISAKDPHSFYMRVPPQGGGGGGGGEKLCDFHPVSYRSRIYCGKDSRRNSYLFHVLPKSQPTILKSSGRSSSSSFFISFSSVTTAMSDTFSWWAFSRSRNCVIVHNVKNSCTVQYYSWLWRTQEKPFHTEQETKQNKPYVQRKHWKSKWIRIQTIPRAFASSFSC